jgi:hypothetical protein
MQAGRGDGARQRRRPPRDGGDPVAVELVHRATPPHPYWPGGAVLLHDGSEPRAIGLLDHLDAAVLH